MKITFVLPLTSTNGGIRVVATYARILHERGHDVTVISQTGPSPAGWKPVVKHLLGIRKRRAAAPSPLLDFLGPDHRIVRCRHPVDPADVPDGDVVVATWWATAEYVAALPASKGEKFYLLQDYEVFPNLPADRVIATYHLPLSKIAVSQYIQNEIETNHGAQVIDVVPNAVDVDQFAAPMRHRNDTITVGFLYTERPRKNIALAIEAIKLARARLFDLRVKAFGSKPPDAALPLPAWVDYHQNPAQQDIPGIYAACDAWLFTSEKEGFGLPILEAMACRTPVLATRAGAAADLIDGTNGTLLPATPEAFADEIQGFAEMSDADWQGYSEAANRTATAHTWQDATDRLLDIFARKASVSATSEASG
jgi:glycosyltransferase involved in cell wall biosynthesis